MNSTGKAARRHHGTRVACKRAIRRRVRRRQFGTLPISVKRGNADAWVREHGGGMMPQEAT